MQKEKDIIDMIIDMIRNGGADSLLGHFPLVNPKESLTKLLEVVQLFLGV